MCCCCSDCARCIVFRFTSLCRYRMPTTQQFAYFFAFVGAGLVFMVIAFSIFLPVIVIAPSKFALSFTLGSLLVMSGFAALRGLKQQASHMFSAARLPFTAGLAWQCYHDHQLVCLSSQAWDGTVCRSCRQATVSSFCYRLSDDNVWHLVCCSRHA